MSSASVKHYGEPEAFASVWHWAEVEGFEQGRPLPDTGVTVTSRGVSELEALDRLRLDHPELGAIRLVKRVKP